MCTTVQFCKANLEIVYMSCHLIATIVNQLNELICNSIPVRATTYLKESRNAFKSGADINTRGDTINKTKATTCFKDKAIIIRKSTNNQNHQIRGRGQP